MQTTKRFLAYWIGNLVEELKLCPVVMSVNNIVFVSMIPPNRGQYRRPAGVTIKLLLSHNTLFVWILICGKDCLVCHVLLCILYLYISFPPSIQMALFVLSHTVLWGSLPPGGRSVCLIHCDPWPVQLYKRYREPPWHHATLLSTQQLISDSYNNITHIINLFQISRMYIVM